MAVMEHFPRHQVTFQFFNRGKTPFPEGFNEELKKQIESMELLSLTKSEKSWLGKKCKFFTPLYLDFLEGYKYDASEVEIIQTNGDLDLLISGYWYRTILWEVPLMALISELYFKMTGQKPIDIEYRTSTNEAKSDLFKKHGVHYADFGTRRRFSLENQDEVVKDFKMLDPKAKNFVGTSNVYLAYKYDVTPIGTHAHEWFMFHAAKYGYKMANKLAMENWTKTYEGDLGIALSDTFTTDVFFKAFNKQYAKLYDGVRQDSGCPLKFADKTIAHYKSLSIDPKDKTIVFSDGLNPALAVQLKSYCRGKIKCSFGIGTNFSNDVGAKALNMVIKMTSAKMPDGDWYPTIKLSDTEGKHTGPESEIQIAKTVLKLK